MCAEGGLQFEGLITLTAFVGLDVPVNSLVLLEVALLIEALTAERTLKRLNVTVRHQVLSIVALVVEGLRAVGTPVGHLLLMSQPVTSEVVVCFEAL